MTRQPVIGRVTGEAIAVKARQSVVSAEPQEPTRVAHDAIDLVLDQAIGSSVGLDWQPLCQGELRERQEHTGATRKPAN